MEDYQPEYNDSNRAFLQAFLARGTLTFKEARPILSAIFTAYGMYSIFHLTALLNLVELSSCRFVVGLFLT